MFAKAWQWSLATSIALSVVMLGSGAEARQDQVLYSFAGGADAEHPALESLSADDNGYLYGTTDRGGANGLGSVFKVAPDGSETIVHSFSGFQGDGGTPIGGVIIDSAGNLDGTTSEGGSSNDGIIYELSPDGAETILYSFNSGYKSGPRGPLLRDKKGNLYGTTWDGDGAAFRLTARGKYIVLHSFAYDQDGGFPVGNLARDAIGSLYGVTSEGGGMGYGTVFKIAADGTFTVLHTFSGGSSDGASPAAGLVLDSAGNLYGTTVAGGGPFGQSGTVFKVTPDGTEAVLTDFGGGNVNYYPESTLVLDRAGNLYGTAGEGGDGGCFLGCGAVFRLAPDNSLRFLHKFDISAGDGAYPEGGVILHKGNLFGTTYGGGRSGYGTIFRMKK
jgi:uncharacterized repeat protein (TIGR03803 family)